MAAKGVQRLFLKKLSPNDNSKNQVYLGGDFEALNIIPNDGVYVDGGREGSKRDRFKANINMSWIDSSGNLFNCPSAQLILYPKYPEVRLSGFLKGCENAPSKILASRQEGRLMFFGVTEDGKIICHAVTANETINKQILNIRNQEASGVFLNIPFADLKSGDTREALLTELLRIHLAGWLDSERLRSDGSLAPCKSPNCGGYTLEAQLGIKPNGYSEPDFLGWEIKQHGVKNLLNTNSGSPITLMTPEPTGGIYKEKGVNFFLKKFGYPDKSGRLDRINFGGIYRHGKHVPSTNLTLELKGFDASSGKITQPDGGFCLVSPKGEEAAVWHFTDIMKHWNRKHAKAAYIPSLSETEPIRRYKYGNIIELGTGTDFLKFLAAIASGKVYYDPGIKLENASTLQATSKRRSQFRIKAVDLKSLYHNFEVVDLLKTK